MINASQKKKYSFFLFFFLLFFTLSCTKDIKYEFDTVVINTTDFEQCEYEQCPEVHIETLALLQPPTLKTVVDTALARYYHDLLTIQGQAVPSLRQDVQAYLNNAQTAYPEDSILSETHELEITTLPSFYNNDILSLQTFTYEYAGGAHGYSKLYYHHFDVATALPLSPLDLIKDVPAFTAFAKAYIAQKNAQNQAQQSELPKFGNQKFILPEVIGLTGEGVHLYYQLFEINDFQQQPAEVIIPWELAQDYLRF